MVRLEHVSFRIEARQRIVFVGPTGADKSTLPSRIVRVYELAAGRVVLDGANRSTVSPTESRSGVSCVEQDSPALPGTVRERVAVVSGCDRQGLMGYFRVQATRRDGSSAPPSSTSGRGG
ncbi:ATP-binding cassette domain-containing protein [Mycetocola spongiae]|uniref:ATP-binding cassette domain-containing protein n=1 Tax=Mycetocola spongiae TaxID=2859226 RepID=UPI001CF43AC9|nr:ATP-binding cassette domain-containing protein [Mycetocola spongiae]